MPDPEAPRRVTPRMLTEPARPARIRALHAAPWLAVGTVCVGAFMGQLDASIVATALPVIRTNLHASIAAVEWVVLVYVLVLVGSVAAVGRLADRVGRKLLYTYGFGIFVAGSAACALAPSLGVLVLARFVQAIGAVMLQANSYALIRDVLPPSRLGTGLGVQGAAQAVGLSVGPALGGALDRARWLASHLPGQRPDRPDRARARAGCSSREARIATRRAASTLRGTLLLAAIPAAPLAALSFAAVPGTRGWIEPSLIGLGAIVVLVAVARQRSTPGSVVDAALLQAPAFVAGICAALLASVVLFGCLVAVPFFLERSLHVGPGTVGLELSALPVSLAVMAPLGGVMRDRMGPRVPTGAGMLLAAVGMALLSASATRADLTVVALGVAGAGMGLFVGANNAATMFAAPPQRAGTAGGCSNMVPRGLGTALGVASASLLLASGRGFASVADLLVGVALLAAVVSVIWSGSTVRIRSAN